MKKTFKLLLLISLCFINIYANDVLYFWSGGITSTSGKVNLVLSMPTDSLRLLVSIDNVFSKPIYTTYTSVKFENGNTASVEITGLQTNTRYYYCFEIDGIKDKKRDHIGSFKTFDEGPFSYKFVAGSCNFFPNNKVYDKMRVQEPLFLLMPGDIHYVNPSSSEVMPHRLAYEERVLQQPREALFLQNIPIAYVWDDHDFCGDNNDGSTGCGLSAYEAYKEYVPYYPLAAPEGSHAIYQSFTVGRIRYIMTDLRSERKSGDIMSVTQKNWFKNEVCNAKNKAQIICWVSTVSFSGNGSDNWGSYTSTRTEISNFFRDSNIVNMFIICGDAHMLAIDNGTHADFTDLKNNKNRYPILQSAALNNIGSDKGGEYSEGGTFPNPPFSSQWSKVEVTDNGGDDIYIKFSCYRANLFTKKQKLITSYEFCRSFTPILSKNSTNQLTIKKEEGSNMLNLELNFTGIANISILDYLGKKIYNQQKTNISNFYKLDLKKIVLTGINYILIETEKGNFVSKLDLNQ